MRSIIAALALTLCAQPAAAGALDLLVPYTKSFPHCSDEKVLATIVKEFNWAEKNTWHRGYGLETVVDPHESTTHDHGYRRIARRYCRGEAVLTNGHHPRVLYMIERGQGFAGTGFNVAWCISSLDPWREYGDGCRVLRY